MTRIPPIWETDPLQFLLNRKFPSLVLLDSEEVRQSNPVLEAQYQKAKQESDEYFIEICKTDSQEIERLIRVEKDKFFEEAAHQVDALDQSRFFSEPYAETDVAFWSAISFWTSDEAVALSLGKDPRLVTLENIEIFDGQSIFVYAYKQRLMLVRRAIEAGQLAERSTPSFFLAWALRTRFFIPGPLIEAVVALGEQVADWKTEHDKIRAALDEHTQKTEVEKASIVGERQEAIEMLTSLYADLTNLSQAHEVLKIEAKELREQCAATKGKAEFSEKPLEARERSTMLKLIYGMAVSFYGYDPSASRNKAVSEIRDDLENKGFKISDDTIRRYLDDAKRNFPLGHGED